VRESPITSPGNADLSDDRVRRSLLRSFGRILGVAKSEAAGVSNDGAKSENADTAASAGNGKAPSAKGAKTDFLTKVSNGFDRNL